METSAKSLQLILFTVENGKSRTLLDDALDHYPGYRVGDVIHLLHPKLPPGLTSADHQYVVRSVKHVISVDEGAPCSPAYILLVGVASLSVPERDELDLNRSVSNGHWPIA